MSKIMIKLNIALLTVIVSIGFGYGQSNDMDFIHSGDEAMQNEKYTEAVYYYLQVDNPSSENNHISSNSKDEIYYPYSLKQKNKSQSNKKKKRTKSKTPTIDNKESLITNKLAKAYRMAKDYTHAEEWYAKTVEHSNNKFPNAAYYYGCTLINNGKYGAAKSVFEKLIENRGDKGDSISQLAAKRIKNCNYSVEKGLEESPSTIRLLEEEINSGTSSYGMMYCPDGLIFASSKESIPYNSDIYTTKRDEGGNFSTPQPFKGKVNTPAIEGAAVISGDGNTLFFTRVDPLNNNQTNIYILRNLNKSWLKPFKLGKNVNLDGYKSMMPCIGGDGKTLYFTSNRPGGYGGMDIWKTKINEKGEATEPINLGGNINTSEDEISPFYHSSSKTLYFSSNGHTGFGGFDVFKSTYNILTDTWNNSDNLGASINSSMDDTYYIWGKDLKHGYLTSDREECESCGSSEVYNIHCNKIYEVENPLFEIKIEGYVYDLDSNLPISNATVKFKSIKGDIEEDSITTDEDGHYERTLVENKEYFIKSDKKGYFADAMVKTTMGMVQPKSIQADFYLGKIPTKEIEIKGIKYDFDSAKLRAESKVILDKLIELLQLNNNLKVEIGSHTDSRGEAKYNFELSQLRARNVVGYLVSHGIRKNRVTAKGKGSSQPAVISINGKEVELNNEFIESLDKEEQEKYYQLNRRTTFKVLNP